jgi:hypothetical protein
MMGVMVVEKERGVPGEGDGSFVEVEAHATL